MSYRLQIRESAKKDLARIAMPDRHRLASKIEALADNPRPAGYVKLSGQSNLWRIRVGNYRVLYQIQDDMLIVLVVHVAHRRDVYRGL